MFGNPSSEIDATDGVWNGSFRSTTPSDIKSKAVWRVSASCIYFLFETDTSFKWRPIDEVVWFVMLPGAKSSRTRVRTSSRDRQYLLVASDNLSASNKFTSLLGEKSIFRNSIHSINLAMLIISSLTTLGSLGLISLFSLSSSDDIGIGMKLKRSFRISMINITAAR